MLKQKKGIKKEIMKGAKLNYNRDIKKCPINADAATIECMRVWIRKAY